MSQRSYTPTLPKSAPIQSELTNSAKQKRIPQIYQTHSRESSNTTNKHKQLPELQTSRVNLPVFKNTPITESYRHSKTNSYDEKSDKKRLVDQFYDQLGTPPPTGPSSSNSNSGHGTRLGTPVITRNNTVNSFNESRTNLVLNDKFEDGKFESSNQDDYEFGGKIGEEISKLEQVIIRRIREQVEINEDEFIGNVDDFHSVLNQIDDIRKKLLNIIQDVNETRINKFNEDYENFQQEIEKFMGFLQVLNEYEDKLKKSREKMNIYKKKLLEIRKTIEFGEMVKIMEHKNSENRNKRIGFFVAISFLAFVYWKLLYQ